MPVTSTNDQESNYEYYRNESYDYKLVAQFFDLLHHGFTRSGFNGAQVERLEASALVGANSIVVILENRDATPYFTVEAENANEESLRQVHHLPTDGTLTERTVAWIATVHAGIRTVLDALRLPFLLPPIVETQPSVGDPVVVTVQVPLPDNV